MAGRKKDHAWNYFHEVQTKTGKGLRAKCKFCSKEIQGIVSRMKGHYSSCNLAQAESGHSISSDSFVDNPQPGTSNGYISPNQYSKRKECLEMLESVPLKKLKLDSFVTRTTPEQKKELDIQVARMIYATNSSFHTVENVEFRRCIEKLRPGYTSPRESAISGYLLNDVYEEELKKCAKLLRNEIVSMSIDGWSNIHNEPIVCSSITTKEGYVYLIDTFDTSGNSHTAEYLQEICEKSIISAEEKFNCKVRSIVTDNASNMAKMRNEMEIDNEAVKANEVKSDDEKLNCVPIITYGCSAHLLNLLAKDLEIPNVTEHVIQIIKYFRNHDFVRAAYKEAGGSSLILPIEVRWNSMCDCLRGYLKNWPILVTVVEVEGGNELIDSQIRGKVLNMAIKRNAEDMVAILKPIAIALDRVQRNSCSLSDAVVWWKILNSELEKVLNKKQMMSFSKRYKQALTPAHFIAYLLNLKLKAKYPEITIAPKEKEAAIEFAKEKYGNEFLSLLMKLLANTTPFTGAIMEPTVMEKLTAVEWWASFAAVKECISETNFEIIRQLLIATASSAGVERIFSTFNIVHSRLRNRLGVEKASKLVFLFKALNKNNES